MALAVAAFSRRPRWPLSTVAEGPVPGVYALYAPADHPVYGRLCRAVPLYVGQTRDLGERLAKHRRRLRRLGLLDGVTYGAWSLPIPWLGLVERALIDAYQPPWNVSLPGFARNVPDPGGCPWGRVHGGTATHFTELEEICVRHPHACLALIDACPTAPPGPAPAGAVHRLGPHGAGAPVPGRG